MNNTIQNHIFSLIWLLLLILPNNNLYFIFVPISYFIISNYKIKQSRIIKYTTLSLVVLLLLSIIININEYYLDYKSISRVIVLIIILISFGRFKEVKILSSYIYFAIIFLITSQFTYVINLEPFKYLLTNYYPYEGDRSTYSIEYYETYNMVNYGIARLGGIYYNPNQYAKYMELVLIVLLCEVKQFKSKELYILIPTILFSLIGTGSRTALIVLLIITLYYLYNTKKLSAKKIIIILIVVLPIISALFIESKYGEFRAFKIEDGMDDSFGGKINRLTSYIDVQDNISKIIFGNVNGSSLGQIYFKNNSLGMDFELGELFYNFGLLFCVLIIGFYVAIFKRYLPKYRVIFVILIWTFSSTIITSYRMSAVWFLVLGMYYQRSQNEISHKE